MGNMSSEEGRDIQEKMLDLTKEMLNLKNSEENCLVPKEAIFNDKIGEKNILVIGLNPAGNKDDADREELGKPYLKYVKYKTPQGEWKEIKGNLKKEENEEEKDNENNKENDIVNNGYFKPIYELVNDVYKEKETDEDKADYSRTDDDIDKIIEQIGIEEESDYLEDLKELKKLLDKSGYEYPGCEKYKRKYTILIGDLFYYHETNSKNFRKKICDENFKINKEDFYYDKKIEEFNKNIKRMLNLHIEKVLDTNKYIEFILINNALASKYIMEALSKKENKNIIDTTGKKDIITYFEYDYEYEEGKKYKIPIFFSGMLSNGGESKYGQARLLNEIREKIKKNS